MKDSDVQLIVTEVWKTADVGGNRPPCAIEHNRIKILPIGTFDGQRFPVANYERPLSDLGGGIPGKEEKVTFLPHERKDW